MADHEIPLEWITDKLMKVTAMVYKEVPRHDAEALINEIMMKIELADRSLVRRPGYVERIARNAITDYWRKRNKPLRHQVRPAWSDDPSWRADHPQLLHQVRSLREGIDTALRPCDEDHERELWCKYIAWLMSRGRDRFTAHQILAHEDFEKCLQQHDVAPPRDDKQLYRWMESVDGEVWSRTIVWRRKNGLGVEIDPPSASQPPGVDKAKNGNETRGAAAAPPKRRPSGWKSHYVPILAGVAGVYPYFDTINNRRPA
jgi:hypothetical protein